MVHEILHFNLADFRFFKKLNKNLIFAANIIQLEEKTFFIKTPEFLDTFKVLIKLWYFARFLFYIKYFVVF